MADACREAGGSASTALGRLLGSSLSVEKFFDSCWETSPRIVRHCPGAASELQSPLLPWAELLPLLRRLRAPEADLPREVEVMVFKDGQPCPRAAYPSCHAAYLDGCSIVVNHLDKASLSVHSLCVDLRKDFPHAYANMYLTPPDSQAVAPHADDRDVIVVQLAGSKSWKVYPDPPIAFPYVEEQVGKSEKYPVPQATLDAKPLLDTELNVGDILYMPRGFVHEALTNETGPSLHLTIALATADWSWSSVVSGSLAVAGKSPEDCARFRTESDARADCPRGPWWWRRSLPPELICKGAADSARKSAEVLMAVVAAEVGLPAQALSKAFAARAAHHNGRQDELTLLPTVAELSFTSFVRRLAPGEAPARKAVGRRKQQGVTARDEIAEALPRILGKITQEPMRISDFENGTLLCEFGKICFASVCIDLGILVQCDAGGQRHQDAQSDAANESCATLDSAPRKLRKGLKRMRAAT